MDLPIEVRHQIYTEAGLVPKQGDPWLVDIFHIPSIISGNCELYPYLKDSLSMDQGTVPHAHLYPQDQWDGYEDYSFQNRLLLDNVPISLFLVSRAISDDARAFFYSRHHFQAIHTAAGGLSAFTRLGPVPTAALQYLTIRMNLCFCPKLEECTDPEHRFFLDCHPCCKAVGHDSPLGHRPGARKDRYLLAELERVCRHLALHLPHDRLRLAFVCDSSNYGLAAQAMKSLLLLPKLRWCSISLSRKYNAQLRKLAETPRLSLTGHPESRFKAPFPFRDLPKELQLKVLHHTGLVAPYHLYYRSKSHLWAPQTIQNGGCFYDEVPLQFAREPSCCCRHREHSVSSWSCSCWHWPTALFTVDREMLRDARQIAFRKNAWVLDPDDIGQIYNASTPPPPSWSFFCENIRDLTVDLRFQPRDGVGNWQWFLPFERLMADCATDKLALSLIFH